MTALNWLGQYVGTHTQREIARGYRILRRVESRRIDDQLRGRSGRQGDPGGSHYFLSLDDPIYRKFGERDQGTQILHALRHRLRNHPRGQPVNDGSVLRTLRELQKKVEVENESIRRDVLRYDVIVDHQRRTIYGWRQTILLQQPEETIRLLRDMVAGLSDGCEEDASSDDDAGDENTRSEAVTELYTTLGGEAGGQEESPEKRAANFRTLIEKRLSDLESILGKQRLAAVTGKVMLSTIDTKWTEHLGNLERADDAVGLRGYAQLDPLLEFTKEAYNLYRAMLIDIRTTTLARLLFMLPYGVQGDGRLTT